jgi:hypothetical protein
MHRSASKALRSIPELARAAKVNPWGCNIVNQEQQQQRSQQVSIASHDDHFKQMDAGVCSKA